MAESLYVEFHDKEQAKRVLRESVFPFLEQELDAGRAVAADFGQLETKRSLKRNAEYWGYVLRPISEQAQVNGIGATAEGWHRYYVEMFLGWVFKKVRKPGAKRPSVSRQLKSTTTLSERAMRDYCEQIRAHAASTFGVHFPAMPMDTARPVKRAKPRTAAQRADPETGEILEEQTA